MIEGFRQEKVPEPTETSFELNGERFIFETYDLGETKDLPNPGLMPTGEWQEAMQRWEGRTLPPSINDEWKQYERVPYTFMLPGNSDQQYGDFTTHRGMDQFKDADLRIQESSNTQEWAQELWRYARLKSPRAFVHNEPVAGLRGLELNNNGDLRFVIGPARYSDAFYSMGSEGIVTGLTPQEREKYLGDSELLELNEKLVREYGEGKTMRQVIVEKMGHLPEFNEGVYNHVLGVAGTVLTQDGKFVFINRGRNVSVNPGINVTASGAVLYDKEALSRLGIHGGLADAMSKETSEELGLKSGELILGAMQERVHLELGMRDVEYELIPVGMAREIPRGGSPETMFLLRYKGTVNDLLRSIIANDHPDRAEIDQFVYAMPAREVRDLIETPGATSVLQHKAILNMIFAIEFLKKHPQN